MLVPSLHLFCLRSLCSLRSSWRTTSRWGLLKPAFRLVIGRACIALLGLAVLALSARGQAGQIIDVADNDVAGLITAIQTLNANGGGSIDLASGGTYSVTQPSDWWYGPNAFPAIASSITINGNGATISRASGSPKFRFFYVSGGFSTLSAGSLTLNDLTLSAGLAQGGSGGNGFGAGGGGAGMGGAIYNQGTTTLNSVTFTSNAALGGSGGVGQNPTDYVGGNSGGGGMGGDGGSAGAGECSVASGGGGFKGTGNAGNQTCYDAGLNWDGGGFMGNEGSINGGTSSYGGNGGGWASGGGAGGGGGYAPGQNGGGAGGSSGGGGAYAAGSGGGGDGALNGYGAGGAAFGGGGAGSPSEGGGGGGIGGGGGGGYWSAGGGGYGGGGGGAYPAGNGGFGGGGGGSYVRGAGGGGFGAASGLNGSGNPGTGGGGGGMGGAIFNQLGMLNVTSSDFVSNSAMGGSGNGASDGFGGAIFNLNGLVLLDEVKYSGNTVFTSTGVADTGAVVYNLSHNGGDIFAGQTPAAGLVLIGTTISNTNGDLTNNQVNGSATVFSGTSAAIASFNPSLLNFGLQPVGYTSPAQTVTLTNTGSAPLTISQVAVTGSGFAIGGNGCVTVLAAGESCQVSVTFNAATGSTFSGQLNFTDNSSLGATLAVFLYGTGAQQSAPTKLVFGPAPPSNVWASGNAGNAIAVIEETAAGVQNYTASDKITLTVTGPGSYSQIYTATASGGIASFNLEGVPLMTPGNYIYTATSGTLTEATASESVEATTVGTQGPTATAALTFTAAGTLELINVLTEGAPNLDFAEATGGTCAIGTAHAIGQTCTVNVIFTPMVPGARYGAVVLQDGSGKTLANVFLQGTGSGPEITYSSTSSTGISSGWDGPSSVAVDGAGNVYVADYNRLSKVPFSGGSYGSPIPLVSADYPSAPNNVAVDGAGNVFYTNSNTVVELPFNGTSYGSPINISDQLNPGWGDPTGIAIDGAGNLFVIDSYNSQVVEVPWTGTGYGAGIAIVSGSQNLPYPLGIAVDSADNVYIADGSVDQIIQFPYTGSGYGSPNYLGSGFTQVSNVAVDATGNVYALDEAGQTISRIPWTGSGWGGQTTVLGLYGPVGLTVDSMGNIYVGAGSSTVEKFTVTSPPSFNFSTSTNIGSVDTADGPQTVSLFNMGNEPLVFSTPTMGSNPSYPAGFPANTSDGSLCSASSTLAQSSSCDVSVNFEPTGAGVNSGSVVITDNALGVSGATQSIAVSGTGVSFPAVTLSASSIAFGSTAVGTWSGSQWVSVTNTGTAPLTITSIAMTGSNTSQFAVGNTCGGTVAVGANCFIHAHFQPTVIGPAVAAVTITDNANDSPQSIGLSGTGAASASMIALSTNSLAYGSANVGTSTASQTVTVSNAGGAAISISSIVVGGINASQFVFGNNCGSSLAAGSSCNIHGHFAPTATGAMTATVTVTDSDTSSPQSIALSGTGVEPLVNLSANSLAFGSVVANTPSESQSVTLTNTGSAVLQISSIAVTGTNASEFAFANNCAASLAVGASCTIHGHFGPSATGAAMAAVTITDNAPDSPESIALSGTGVPATQSVTLSSTNLLPGSTPTNLVFGSIDMDTWSASQTVIMTNTGSTTLAISSITVGGVNASQFAFGNTCGASLAVGANCLIQGHFAPTGTGAMAAAVTITDSATNSPQMIALSGTGVTAAISLSSTSLSYAPTTVGTSSGSQSVTMTNIGSSALTITSIAVTGADAGSFVFANNCGTSLAVGASCMIHGHFAPTATGVMAASVTITTSAAGSPQSIALSGRGQ